jgi:uncharacterized protein YfbU (UPF0304 family)
MKPGTPVLRSTRLLDQLQERIRYLHYSLNTEKAYLHWVRFFVRWGTILRRSWVAAENMACPLDAQSFQTKTPSSACIY